MIFCIILAVAFYMALVLWGIGLLLCSMYAHYSKRRSAVTQRTQSESVRTDTVNSNNKPMRQTAKISLKRRLTKNINLYLYGLCRYYSILIGRIPSQRIRNLLMIKKSGSLWRV